MGFWGESLITDLPETALFRIGNHFEADVRQNFVDTLSKAIEQDYAKEMLADTLKDQFNDLANRSSRYRLGLAEHTALRIREFGRLQGYKKSKARFYKLVVIPDDRTSDICRALAAQDKVYPLNDALEGDVDLDKPVDKNFAIKDLSEQEILNKLEGIRHDKYPNYSDNDFESDIKDHGKDFGINTKQSFLQKARDIYKHPDNIRCRMYEGQLQFTFYSQTHGGYVVADTNGVIRGCYAHPKQGAIEKTIKATENMYYNIKGVTK